MLLLRTSDSLSQFTSFSLQVWNPVPGAHSSQFTSTMATLGPEMDASTFYGLRNKQFIKHMVPRLLVVSFQ